MALLRDNLFVDGLDNLALSTDEALVEAASDGVLHQYPGTSGVSISYFFVTSYFRMISQLGI